MKGLDNEKDEMIRTKIHWENEIMKGWDIENDEMVREWVCERKNSERVGCWKNEMDCKVKWWVKLWDS